MKSWRGSPWRHVRRSAGFRASLGTSAFTCCTTGWGIRFRCTFFSRSLGNVVQCACLAVLGLNSSVWYDRRRFHQTFPSRLHLTFASDCRCGKVPINPFAVCLSQVSAGYTRCPVYLRGKSPLKANCVPIRAVSTPYTLKQLRDRE